MWARGSKAMSLNYVWTVSQHSGLAEEMTVVGWEELVNRGRGAQLSHSENNGFRTGVSFMFSFLYTIV